MIIFTAVLLPEGAPGAGPGRPGAGVPAGAPTPGGPVTAAPHFSQNLVPSASTDPQLAQNVAMIFPPEGEAQISLY